MTFPFFQVSFHGETGVVNFDHSGRRQNFSFNIFEFDGINFTKVNKNYFLLQGKTDILQLQDIGIIMKSYSTTK